MPIDTSVMKFLLTCTFLAYLLGSTSASVHQEEIPVTTAGDEVILGEAVHHQHRKLEFLPDINCTNTDKNFNYDVELRFPGMVNSSYGYPTGPDPNCAAGLGLIIGVTMLNVEIREKAGTPVDVKSLRDFFKVLDPPRPYVFQDPKIIYD